MTSRSLLPRQGSQQRTAGAALRIVGASLALTLSCTPDDAAAGAGLRGDDLVPGAADALAGAAGLDAALRQEAALQAAATIEAAFLLDRVGVLAHDDFLGRDNGTPGGLAAQAWLATDLANQGLPPLAAAGYALPFAAGVNLCARIAGSDATPTVGADGITRPLRDELVLLGAHYDHLGDADTPGSACKAAKDAADRICNGAIDNAAGVAVTIAVARALANSPGLLRRTLVVCLFDAEEDGLLGSKALVQALQQEGVAGVHRPQVVAMLSVDNVGSQIIPGELSSFATDAEFSDALRAAVHAANAITGYQTWPVSSFFVGQEGGGRSDHLPFREAGVPVLFLGSGSGAEYHTPHDELDALDQSKLLAIARHAVVLVSSIANADARPDFQAKPSPHLDDGRALVSLADRALAASNPLKLNDTQREVVATFRSQLQGWLDHPPATAADWKAYQTQVKAILAAVFSFVGGHGGPP